jgi:hypothetical protein
MHDSPTVGVDCGVPRLVTIDDPGWVGASAGRDSCLHDLWLALVIDERSYHDKEPTAVPVYALRQLGADVSTIDDRSRRDVVSTIPPPDQTYGTPWAIDRLQDFAPQPAALCSGGT